MITSPAGTVAKPYISRTDSNTLYTSSTAIFFGEMTVIFPFTLSSITKFRPVSSLMNLMKTWMSTLSKSIVT